MLHQTWPCSQAQPTWARRSILSWAGWAWEWGYTRPHPDAHVWSVEQASSLLIIEDASFALMKIEAFSRNVGKISNLKVGIRLFSFHRYLLLCFTSCILQWGRSRIQLTPIKAHQCIHVSSYLWAVQFHPRLGRPHIPREPLPTDMLTQHCFPN